MGHAPLIAIVDDEPHMRQFYASYLEEAGFETGEYCDGEDFLDRYTPKPGCVLLNYRMPRRDGLDVLWAMKRRGWRVPVIAFSSDRHCAEEFLYAGAKEFLPSPVEPDVLLAAVCRHLEDVEPDAAVIVDARPQSP